jgi:hypothetical protein
MGLLAGVLIKPRGRAGKSTPADPSEKDRRANLNDAGSSVKARSR